MFSIGGASSDELILTTACSISNQALLQCHRSRDRCGGLTYDETLTVTVNDLNETPTDIAPNSFAVDENTDTTSGSASAR